jgi:UDP-N-acetylmuramoyl-L-alanyl-D-glutamate--2,6-diaminopimelate ligase
LAPPSAAALADNAHLPLIADENPRRRYALMAARFYGDQPEFIAAVTGTNGKSSVVSFTRQVWQRLGRRAASMGTLGVSAPGFEAGPSLTTPDPADLHKTLAALAKDGIDHLAFEASSHGLDQYRSDGVRLAAAAFTNLTRDHLDYHGTEAAYFQAKARLFEELLPAGGAAVLNANSDQFDALCEISRRRGHRIISYGIGACDVKLVSCERQAGGQRLEIVVEGETHHVETGLVGDFQAENLMCALALAIGCGENAAAAVQALGGVAGVPGRLELIARRDDGATLYVDYAHTPDALVAALRAMRAHTDGRLHLVFGCGGDRDPGKRPQMGAIAAELADQVIVTDDNPRDEDPATIRAEILAACPNAADVGDRAEAIMQAVRKLGAGDVLLIAGKGHEAYQIVGAETIPFDDAEFARKALSALGGSA